MKKIIFIILIIINTFCFLQHSFALALFKNFSNNFQQFLSKNNAQNSPQTDPLQQNSPQSNQSPQTQQIYDLRKLSSNMQYAQVYNMLMEAERYNNARVKIHGIFYENTDEIASIKTQSVMVSDVTLCCVVGFDLLNIPQNIHPKHLEKIEVDGIFQVQEVNGITRSYLKVDSLKLL